VRAEDFAAARRDGALADHAAITVMMAVAPPIVIARANASSERANPHTDATGNLDPPVVGL